MKEELRKIFYQEPHVLAVYLFGSFVLGKTHNRSDFDLAVVVDDRQKIDEKTVYKLISHLSFPRDLDLSVIDRHSSPLFLFQIIKNGQRLYQRDPRSVLDFESFVMWNYADNKHIREIYATYLPRKFGLK